MQAFYDQEHAALTRGASPFDRLTIGPSPFEELATWTELAPTVTYHVVRPAERWPETSKPWLAYIEGRLGEIERETGWPDSLSTPLTAARRFVESVLFAIDPPAPSVAAIDEDNCIEFTWQKNGMQLIASFSADDTEIVWLSNAKTGSAQWPSVEAFTGFFDALTRVSSDALGASLAGE